MKKFIMCLATLSLMLIIGCATARVSNEARFKTTDKDGVVTERYARNNIFAFGDRAVEQNLKGSLADATDGDLSAGIKESTQKSEAGMVVGLMDRLIGTAGTVAAAYLGRPVASAASVAPGGVSVPPDAGGPYIAPTPPLVSTVPIDATALNAAIVTAKATGKILVVIAGNPLCSYCAKLDAALEAAPAFLARTDIVLYRESADWAANSASKWTGGGNAPIMRVTQFDPDGTILCDSKVNRPQTVAAITAAITACVAP